MRVAAPRAARRSTRLVRAVGAPACSSRPQPPARRPSRAGRRPCASGRRRPARAPGRRAGARRARTGSAGGTSSRRAG